MNLFPTVALLDVPVHFFFFLVKQSAGLFVRCQQEAVAHHLSNIVLPILGSAAQRSSCRTVFLSTQEPHCFTEASSPIPTSAFSARKTFLSMARKLSSGSSSPSLFVSIASLSLSSLSSELSSSELSPLSSS